VENDRPTPDGPEPDSSHDAWTRPHDAGTGPDGAGPRPDDFALEELEEAAPPTGTHTALPPKLEAWRRRSAAGAILTGFALGLQEALEKRKEEPGIVMQTSGDPPKDLPVEADFEYGRPRQSVVQIRPWLLTDGDGVPASDPEPTDRPTNQPVDRGRDPDDRGHDPDDRSHDPADRGHDEDGT
jgi:hypothetical protein